MEGNRSSEGSLNHGSQARWVASPSRCAISLPSDRLCSSLPPNSGLESTRSACVKHHASEWSSLICGNLNLLSTLKDEYFGDHADAFASEAPNGTPVWGISDRTGFPTSTNASGETAMPFRWSERASCRSSKPAQHTAIFSQGRFRCRPSSKVAAGLERRWPLLWSQLVRREGNGIRSVSDGFDGSFGCSSRKIPTLAISESVRAA